MADQILKMLRLKGLSKKCFFHLLEAAAGVRQVIKLVSYRGPILAVMVPAWYLLRAESDIQPR